MEMLDDNFGELGGEGQGSKIDQIVTEHHDDDFAANGNMDLIRLLVSNKDLSNHLNTLRNVYG